MRRFLVIPVLFLLFNCGYAQKKIKIQPDYSSIITTKKIILHYQHNEPDSLMIPIVSDKYPELKRALSDTNLFLGDKLDTVIHHYQNDGTGITSFNYQVIFANKDVISLKLYYETMGAHPDQSEEWLTLNMHTGAAYPISNEVNPEGMEWIYMSYKELLKKRIADDENGLDKEKVDESYADVYKDLKESVDELTSEELLKRYVFTDKGVSFTTEKVLPAAVRNFEPERDWLIPYIKLKAYIQPGSMVLK